MISLDFIEAVLDKAKFLQKIKVEYLIVILLICCFASGIICYNLDKNYNDDNRRKCQATLFEVGVYEDFIIDFCDDFEVNLTRFERSKEVEEVEEVEYIDYDICYDEAVFFCSNISSDSLEFRDCKTDYMRDNCYGKVVEK